MAIRHLTTTSLSLLLMAAPAAAQQGGQQANGAEPQMAEECVSDLRAFDEEARREGYSLIGPGAAGVRPGGAVTPRATPPGAGTGGVTTAARGPYGVGGPRRDLQVLYQAAYVFARRGDEEACQMVLAETRQMLEQRTARLQEAGISREEIRGWRAEELAAAQPVEEVGRLRIDEITGADVRNLQDEDLGDIEDVLLDPESRQISHALISRGGILGMGQDHVAVPWGSLRAAPNMDTFVLDVPEAVLEQAPKIDPDAFGSAETYDERRQAADAYWNEAMQQR